MASSELARQTQQETEEGRQARLTGVDQSKAWPSKPWQSQYTGVYSSVPSSRASVQGYGALADQLSKCDKHQHAQLVCQSAILLLTGCACSADGQWSHRVLNTHHAVTSPCLLISLTAAIVATTLTGHSNLASTASPSSWL